MVIMTKSIYTKKYNQFRNLLIDARKHSGLSQTQLSKIVSKPQSFISKYEIGERRLDVIEFLEISKALNINPIDILNQLIS